MAIVHGGKKAGQHAKGQAHDRTRQMWAASLVACAATGVVIGFLVAILVLSASSSVLAFARHFWLTLLALEVAVGVGLLAVVARLDRAMDGIYRRRIRWLRGGQAEGLVAWYFKDLSDDWHVFHNVMIGAAWDLDHILVGPPGIFAISTKSQRGLYTLRGGEVLRNNTPTEHANQAVRMAMELKDRIQSLAGEVQWVQPVLVAPFAFVEFGAKQTNPWVLHERDLMEAFENAPKKLTKAEVDRFAGAVEMTRARGVGILPK